MLLHAKIERICLDAGYQLPRIGSPEAILQDSHVR